jgi:ATP-dependent protease HslVU (ClpYQ) peptidase subunit
VTVIVALAESEESILIAADSRETEAPGDLASVYLNKLKRHPSAHIVWATAGNGGVGEAFSNWLAAVAPPPQTWRDMSDQAAEHLARLNGRRRELAELAKTQLQENDTTSVLLAGWLDSPEIVELDDRGIATPYFERGVCAIGTGKPHALIAYQALNHIGGVSRLQKLWVVMSVATVMVHDCGPPVHVKRITADGVVDLASPTPSSKPAAGIGADEPGRLPDAQEM